MVSEGLVHTVGQALCERWGMDPSQVRRITIVFDAVEPFVYAHVVLLPDEVTVRMLLDLAPVEVP
jgi:hypothetical protein